MPRNMDAPYYRLVALYKYVGWLYSLSATMKEDAVNRFTGIR